MKLDSGKKHLGAVLQAHSFAGVGLASGVGSHKYTVQSSARRQGRLEKRGGSWRWSLALGVQELSFANGNFRLLDSRTPTPAALSLYTVVSVWLLIISS